MLDKRVDQLLKELADENGRKGRVFYYANNGNAGDALINMGFYSVAKKIGLNFIPIKSNSNDELCEDDVVVVAGGGTIVPEWPATSSFIRSISKKKSRIIILPQSIRGADEVIEGLPEGSVIFCREKYSYDYCKRVAKGVDVYFDHDVALSADVIDIMKNYPVSPGRGIKKIIRLLLCEYHALRSILFKKIYAMRCDKEASSTVNMTRLQFNDASVVASFGAGDYADSAYSAKKFLKLIDGYEVIHTDRLHVAVAGFLLRKKVYIYNNNYFKCKGVFEASLVGRGDITLIE